MEHLTVTAIQDQQGTRYRIEVWAHYWEYKLGDEPTRTYFRNSIGKVAFEVQEELRGKRSFLRLPNN